MNHLLAHALLCIALLCSGTITPALSADDDADSASSVVTIHRVSAIDAGTTGQIRRAITNAETAMHSALVLVLEASSGPIDLIPELVDLASAERSLPLVALVDGTTSNAGTALALACNQVSPRRVSACKQTATRLVCGWIFKREILYFCF